MSAAQLRDAVAAGVLAGQQGHRPLLQSIVETARSIFGAQASSILLHDAGAKELVFEAVAGKGSDSLVGRRIPDSKGLAGWVLASHEPIVIEDVRRDPRFARDVAEDTGYTPKGIMAAPLLHDETALGVLSVLDRPQRVEFSLLELDLLGLFANQAAIALNVLETTRRVQAILAEEKPETVALARLAASLDALGGRRHDAAARLLTALEEVLRG